MCPSLFAGDTPPVHTALANAILVVGPCLWVLLGDVHMKTDQAHTIQSSGGLAQFFKMSSLNLVEYLWVCVYMCLCACLLCFRLCVVCVCTEKAHPCMR